MIASMIVIFFTFILNLSDGRRLDGLVSRNSKVVIHHTEPSETLLRSWPNANSFNEHISTQYKEVRPNSLSHEASQQRASNIVPATEVKVEQSVKSESHGGIFKLPLFKVETLKYDNEISRQDDESFQVNDEKHRIKDEVNRSKSKNNNNVQFQILDALDNVMMQEQDIIDSKQPSSCTKPKLGFCGEAVKYPITQAQMSIHSLYDGLAEAALDFITIQTKGQVRSCKKELQNILCRDRFPRCKGQAVIWENLREMCGKAIASCPVQVQETLRNIDLCRKLGNGITSINECVPPIQSQYSKHHQLIKDNHVAPWDKHVSVEVQYLIEMQQTLFGITGTCLKSLYSYLCLPAKTCYSNANFLQLKSEFNNQCKIALKSCENSTLSKGMEVFFQCKQLEATEFGQ